MNSRSPQTRPILAVVLAAVLGALTLFAAPVPARADTEPLSLVFTDVRPAVVRPSDTLELTGTITNSGTTAFTDPQVQIAVQWSVPRTMDGVTGWFDTESPPGARLEYTGQLTLTVQPGQTSQVRISVPMSEIAFPIRFDNWGPRGLEVTLSTAEASVAARTMGVFYPEEDLETEPVRVAALVAATPAAWEWESSLEESQLVDPAVAERIKAVTSISGATAAIDPSVLSTAATLDAIALPWADADLGLLASAGDPGWQALADARERSREAFAASVIEATDSVAWPLPWDVDGDLVWQLRNRGFDSIVLSDSALPDPDSGTADARIDLLLDEYDGAASAAQAGASRTPSVAGTPTGETPTDAAADATADPTTEETDDGMSVMRAVVGNDDFTALLTGAPEVEGVEGVDEALTARQLTLGMSAVVARESSAGANLLAVIDRAWAGLDQAESDAIGTRLTALANAPWVELLDVPAMLALDAPATTNASDLTATTTITTRERGALNQAANLSGLIDDLTSAFEDDTPLLSLQQNLTLTPSAAWRADGESGAVVTRLVQSQLDAMTTGVTVAPPESNVNLFAEESALPIVVTNTMEVPVTVHIRVSPEQPALRVEGTPDVTLEAQSSQTVRVPVTALANGTTQVDVDITSPDGAPLGQRATFQMTVQAEWESVTTGLLAAALGVLLVLGLVRNIRRGRRRDDGQPSPPPQHRAPATEAAS